MRVIVFTAVFKRLRLLFTAVANNDSSRGTLLLDL